MGVAVRMACLEILTRDLGNNPPVHCAMTAMRREPLHPPPRGGVGFATARLYRNARLLDPASGLDAPGDLLVEGDRIAALGGDRRRHRRAMSRSSMLDGLCLAPGLVDMRVQLREPGAEHMESIESGGQAAAAGGVTTMVALPNTEPPVDDVSVVEFLARRAREVKLAKIHTYAAATKGLAGPRTDRDRPARGERRGRLHRRGQGDRRRAGHAPGAGLCPQLRPAGGPASGGAEPRPAPARSPKARSRPGSASPAITPAAEIIMIERDLRLVEITGARYHVAHVSTAAGDRGDPPGQGGRAAGDLRYRPALFRAERDRDRRLPHLRQTVAAVAQRSRPPRRRRGPARRHDRRDRQRPRAVGPGFEAPAVQLGEPTASSGWRPCCRCRSSSTTTAISRLLEVMRRLTVEPGAHSAARRSAGCAPARRPISCLFDPDRAVAHLHRRVPLEIEERAVRRPPGAGPGRAHDRRRPHDLRGRMSGMRCRLPHLASPARVASLRSRNDEHGAVSIVAADAPLPHAARAGLGVARRMMRIGRDPRRHRRLPARLDPVRAGADAGSPGSATSAGSARAISARPTSCAPATRRWPR